MGKVVKKIRRALILNHLAIMPQVVVLPGRRGLNQIELIVVVMMAVQEIKSAPILNHLLLILL
jgi:hypothetical protein